MSLDRRTADRYGVRQCICSFFKRAIKILLGCSEPVYEGDRLLILERTNCDGIAPTVGVISSEPALCVLAGTTAYAVGKADKDLLIGGIV